MSWDLVWNVYLHLAAVLWLVGSGFLMGIAVSDDYFSCKEWWIGFGIMSAFCLFWLPMIIIAIILCFIIWKYWDDIDEDLDDGWYGHG